LIENNLTDDSFTYLTQDQHLICSYILHYVHVGPDYNQANIFFSHQHYVVPVLYILFRQRRRPGSEFGEGGHFFRYQDLWMTSFPFLRKKTHYFRKQFLDDTFFLLCSYFCAHPTTLLPKILGGRMHGPSPTSNYGGTIPPVPLGLRPCFRAYP